MAGENDTQKPDGKAVDPASVCSATVVHCTCGKEQRWQDTSEGKTRQSAKKLIAIFRHFHEQHGEVGVYHQTDVQEDTGYPESAHYSAAKQVAAFMATTN